jgi:hypothetical protein
MVIQQEDEGKLKSKVSLKDHRKSCLSKANKKKNRYMNLLNRIQIYHLQCIEIHRIFL